MGILIDLWVGMVGYSIWWINPQGDHPAHLRGEVRVQPVHVVAMMLDPVMKMRLHGLNINAD
ncbi:hypothetical protein MA16_Dca027096 [Dendrobium catenatum]|uniref:Uncharacterized protein n=1 Tax=Dendrobium catenatum TaxID=906689 RepID=A0A2I0VYK4_9ASPA|nr:hypothetical protein MA16_Dca027096 [Dendrobium catenatum]